MGFSRGSIHLPINSPLWWEAVYTGRRVSRKVEREGEERVQMVGNEWHVLAQTRGRMEGQQ